ncbi:hypothetical protein R6Q59_029236 [Mikania micrantha]
MSQVSGIMVALESQVVKALSWFELVVSCQRFVQSLFTTELVAVYCRKEVALKWQVSDTFMRFCLGLSPCFSLSRSVSSEMVRALGSIPERLVVRIHPDLFTIQSS